MLRWRQSYWAAFLLGSFVVHGDDAGDTAASTPVAFERCATGLGHGYEIVKNAIRDIFVEDAFISEALQVQFEALEFDAKFVRHIAEYQYTEIRLACFRANRSELGAADFNLIVTLRKTVVENFKFFAKICGHLQSPLAEVGGILAIDQEMAVCNANL